MRRNSPARKARSASRAKATAAVAGAALGPRALAAFVPADTAELTPAAKAMFEGMGKAIVDRFAVADISEVLTTALAPPPERHRPAREDSEASALAELKAVRQEMEMLRKQMGELEREVVAFRKFREDLEGVSFDRAMTRVWGKRWNPKRILGTKKPARPGLGLSEEEWAAVLQEA